jgi:hypothetical protein
VTFSQKAPISEKDVKLASRDLNGFTASKCFMAPQTGNMLTITSSDNAELLSEDGIAIFTICTKKAAKN